MRTRSVILALSLAAAGSAQALTCDEFEVIVADVQNNVQANGLSCQNQVAAAQNFCVTQLAITAQGISLSLEDLAANDIELQNTLDNLASTLDGEINDAKALLDSTDTSLQSQIDSLEADLNGQIVLLTHENQNLEFQVKALRQKIRTLQKRLRSTQDG